MQALIPLLTSEQLSNGAFYAEIRVDCGRDRQRSERRWLRWQRKSADRQGQSSGCPDPRLIKRRSTSAVTNVLPGSNGPLLRGSFPRSNGTIVEI